MKKIEEFHKKHRGLYLLFFFLLGLTAISALSAFTNSTQSPKQEQAYKQANENVTVLKMAKETPIAEEKTEIKQLDKKEGSLVKENSPTGKNSEIATSSQQNPEVETEPPKEESTAKSPEHKPKNEAEAILATLKVNGKSFSIDIPKGGTVFDLMNTARTLSYISFESKDFGGDLGYFVESINGISNGQTKNHYWIYYINGAKAKAGISNYSIQQNDIISWNYEASTL